jgi:hypothetical protein
MKTNYLFASLRSLKKGVGSGLGSGSIIQRCRSANLDPDPHQNVTDPQHWFYLLLILVRYILPDKLYCHVGLAQFHIAAGAVHDYLDAVQPHVDVRRLRIPQLFTDFKT